MASPRHVAVVGLAGRELRYAEVEAGASPRLRRLGTCDFEGDVSAAVFADGAAGGGDADTLDALCAALADVYDGAALDVLVVTAHPTETTGFFAPLPDGLAPAVREEQLRQEAALLSDLPPSQPVRIRAVPVRTEQAADGGRTWYHVVHVAEPVHARLALLAQAVGAPAYDLADTARAVSTFLRQTVPAGVTMAVGVYPAHTEVAVVRNGALLFGYHGAGRSPEDTAYFALAAAERAGVVPEAVDRVALYGEPAAMPGRLAILDDMLGRTGAPLDPFDVFGRRPAGLAPEEAAAFAPLLGASIV